MAENIGRMLQIYGLEAIDHEGGGVNTAGRCSNPHGHAVVCCIAMSRIRSVAGGRRRQAKSCYDGLGIRLAGSCPRVRSDDSLERSTGGFHYTPLTGREAVGKYNHSKRLASFTGLYSRLAASPSFLLQYPEQGQFPCHIRLVYARVRTF